MNRSKELTEYLYRISEAKLQLMVTLLEATQEQQQALEEENLEVLDQAIGKKNKIIEKIDVLDKEFAEKYQDLKEALGIEDLSKVEEEPVEGFKDLKEKIQEIMATANKVNQMDQENMKKMKKDMEKVQSKIKNARTGKKAMGSYNKKYKQSESIFIDKKK
ncbi:flagellar export chaperone FlgN [Isachenkonia alkalipeptolytica]|uniref:Flagellar protein FlgN n=1 Tax=Isachenkonia alkalipeptolytica TaxID=2565777 RepID=A0AA44BEX3_9CLOT|nr:flagellar export chaperone FlgN [Isachenkonia alkalipeptolytica]NBG89398.1 flagellar protein FlgN [Isachenkonia alkalipeptolytica]